METEKKITKILASRVHPRKRSFPVKASCENEKWFYKRIQPRSSIADILVERKRTNDVDRRES